jgi:hypothetical protein
MSRLLMTLFAIAVIGLLLSIVGIAAVVATGGDPLGHAVVSVNDHEVVLAGLQGNLPLLALVGLVVAVVMVVVVPLAVGIPLVLVAFGLALGVLAIAAATALLLSPLILIGWGLWRLARPAPVTPV